MKIIKETYNNYAPLYPIEEFCPIENALFIDIETTGLSKETTSLYLIGCGYYQDNSLVTKLFFADNPSEEIEILNLFLDFVKGFTHLFHFNGCKFDIPYLTYKLKKYNIENIFDGLTQIDIYNLIKPLRHLLFPSSMRQKCVEDFLHITRKDKYNGGELIEVYNRYVTTRADEDFEPLITHNTEDVIGMHKIMPILHYLKLLNTQLTYVDHTINSYKNYYGDLQKELIMIFKSSIAIPDDFNSKTNTMYLKASHSQGTITLRLPIYTCEMKLFFDNYKDYYYLPDEDTCIHRSVAMGLSKNQYIKATKSNCYIKRNGDFLKQPKSLFTPVFKSSYKDKANYFSFPDSFDLEKCSEYGNELFEVFINGKR